MTETVIIHVAVEQRGYANRREVTMDTRSRSAEARGGGRSESLYIGSGAPSFYRTAPLFFRSYEQRYSSIFFARVLNILRNSFSSFSSSVTRKP